MLLGRAPHVYRQSSLPPCAVCTKVDPPSPMWAPASIIESYAPASDAAVEKAIEVLQHKFHYKGAPEKIGQECLRCGNANVAPCLYTGYLLVLSITITDAFRAIVCY